MKLTKIITEAKSTLSVAELVEAGEGVGGEADLAQIAHLAHKIWNIHYPPIVGQAQVDYMLYKFYALPALQQQVAEGQQFYLIENEGQNIGFIALTLKENNHLFINKFYIDNTQQGKGLGKQVFEEIKKLFPQIIYFTLTVNRQNFTAINFYFKIGFTIKEVSDFDIGNGYVMNDFVMECKKIIKNKSNV